MFISFVMDKQPEVIDEFVEESKSNGLCLAWP